MQRHKTKMINKFLTQVTNIAIHHMTAHMYMEKNEQNMRTNIYAT